MLFRPLPLPHCCEETNEIDVLGGCLIIVVNSWGLWMVATILYASAWCCELEKWQDKETFNQWWGPWDPISRLHRCTLPLCTLDLAADQQITSTERPHMHCALGSLWADETKLRRGYAP